MIIIQLIINYPSSIQHSQRVEGGVHDPHRLTSMPHQLLLFLYFFHFILTHLLSFFISHCIEYCFRSSNDSQVTIFEEGVPLFFSQLPFIFLYFNVRLQGLQVSLPFHAQLLNNRLRFFCFQVIIRHLRVQLCLHPFLLPSRTKIQLLLFLWNIILTFLSYFIEIYGSLVLLLYFAPVIFNFLLNFRTHQFLQ